MDQDRDGTVSLDDLKEVYASLGNRKTKEMIG
jgi:Ca2+-binding EF-hand superfamily protein